MPASEYREGIAGKAMHRADMRSLMAVEILNPKMAAHFSDEFELVPQQLCVAAKALGPDALARPFIKPQGCEHRARRTPHQFADGIVAVGVNGVPSWAATAPRHSPCLDEKNAGIGG